MAKLLEFRLVEGDVDGPTCVEARFHGHPSEAELSAAAKAWRGRKGEVLNEYGEACLTDGWWALGDF